MEEPIESAGKITARDAGIRYGVILSCLSILYFVTVAATGANMTEGIGRWGGLIFTVGVLWFAHKYYKENGDGFMSIGQGVAISFWVSLISSVISSIFTFVYVKYIDDGFIQNLKDRQYDQFLEEGMSDSQIEQAMSISESFMTPNALLLFGIFGGIAMGLIIGLVIALFTQRKNPDFTV